jgi:serine O-acetyltransferase
MRDSQRGFSEVISLIREDYSTNNRRWSSPGFRALFVYRIDSWRQDIPNRFLRIPLTFMCGVASRWVRNHHGIELPPTATIGRRLHLIHWGGVVLHKYAILGDDCTILHGVTLGAAGDVDREKAPLLGNGVQVGTGAVILGAVVVGDRARIGPNAVVTMDVPADGTAFANPARVIYAPAVANPRAPR